MASFVLFVLFVVHFFFLKAIFMPSITSWTRLEPHCRNAEMDTSVQARVYDPLWLMARQWQVGEELHFELRKSHRGP